MMVQRAERRGGRIGVGASVLAGFHFVAIASPAYAQGPVPVAGQPPPPEAAPVAGAGGDVIVLKSGGMLQGTLIDAIPGSHARIQLRTGEIATVRWTEIDHIERTAGAAGAPSGAVATTPPPVAGPVAAPPPPGPAVYVHIESDATVELQQLKPSGEWVTACVSPCDRSIGIDPEYRITGSGVRTTPSFHIAAEQGQRVVLQVTPRNGGLWGLGLTGTIVGGLGIFVGLVVILVGASENATNDITATTGTTANHSSGDATEATGLGILGVSTLALVGGIVLMATNGRTKVDQATYASDAQPPPPPPPEARLPTWREIGSAVPRAPTPVTTVPLLRGTF